MKPAGSAYNIIIKYAVVMVNQNTLTDYTSSLPFIFTHELAHTLPIVNHESALYLMYPSTFSSYRLSPEMTRDGKTLF